MQQATLKAWYRWRARRGKEDLARLSERFGVASMKRPAGRLIWAHAVSVGECRAMEPLLRRLRAQRPETNILVTTGTTSAAQIIAQRYSVQVMHQYFPAPLQPYIDKFIAHWSPNVALFCESELWPQVFRRLHAARIPCAVFNARMSPRSHRKWKLFHALGGNIGSGLTRCLAQNEANAARFAVTGCADIRITGNVKFDAPPLAADASELQKLLRPLEGRPVWIAASTRPGEEQYVIAAHRAALKVMPDLCTIWVPRHPERSDYIARLLTIEGIKFTRRSQGELPNEQLFIGDSLGEMGLYYRLAKLVFVGGSLGPGGGQNPIEPIQLGAAIISGAKVYNFSDVFDDLWLQQGAIRVKDANGLARAVVSLLSDPEEMGWMSRAGISVIERHLGALDETWAALSDLV